MDQDLIVMYEQDTDNNINFGALFSNNQIIFLNTQ